jgi:hypothetical protein
MGARGEGVRERDVRPPALQAPVGGDYSATISAGAIGNGPRVGAATFDSIHQRDANPFPSKPAASRPVATSAVLVSPSRTPIRKAAAPARTIPADQG